jgi:3-hydroxybutyryl-CoA dehydrogenase
VLFRPNGFTNTMNKKTAHKSAAVVTVPAAVVGQGVMGAIITTCLLAAGHPVHAIALEEKERRSAKRRVRRHLDALHQAGKLAEPPTEVLRRLHLGADFAALAPCGVVIESIIEDLDAKRAVLARIESAVARDALIGSNTSALAVTEIQRGARHPERVLGTHWISSSPFGSMVEVMGGAETTPTSLQRAGELVRGWGMTPAVLHHEKRGFICNRVLYAMFRETLALLEEGVATREEIDDVIRTSTGTWLPFVGPLEYLDLAGLTIYPSVIRGLFPDLDSRHSVPASLQALTDSGAQGVANGRGFYQYHGTGGAKRRRDLDDFRRDLSVLSAKYEPGRKLRRPSS